MQAIEFEVKRAEHRDTERKEKNILCEAELSSSKKKDAEDR